MNDPTRRRSLERLPDEMVIRVLLFCGYKDILLFSPTCKRYYDIVSSSVALQLHIELEINGLQIARDVPDDTRDHLSLLTKLRRHRDAWLDLDLGPPVQQYCGGNTMHLWELQDGVFAKGVITPNTESPFHSKPNSLLLFPLGAVDNTRVDFGCQFDEFTMDPSQDLAVLVGINREVKTRGWACFHSTITGQAHPQAAHPLLTVELGFVVLLNSIFDLVLDIKGDLVAVKFSSPIARLYEVLIWNWKTGSLLNRIGCYDGICNFVFLDDNRLVLWCARRAAEHDLLGSVELLIYEQIGSITLRHEALDGQPLDISLIPSLVPALTFQFPKLRGSSVVGPRGFLLRSDYGSRASFATSAPFANSRAHSLGLTMTLLDGGGNIPLRIFVDTHQLLRHLDQAKQQSISTLPWAVWGENATRWFHAGRQDHWVCWIFGSRFIIGGERVSVVDFHTPTVRRYMNRQRDTYTSFEPSPDHLKERERIHSGHWPAYIHERNITISSDQPDGPSGAALSKNAVVINTVGWDQPTSLPYFDEPVISRLPYRIVTRARRVASRESWLISGNHLVGIAHNFGSQFSSNKLAVYTIGGSGEAADGV